MNTILNSIEEIRGNAVKIFHKGLQAVEPGSAIKRSCKREGDNLLIGNKKYNLSGIKNIFVTGAGKATAPMAAAIEDILGENITSGIINVKYGHTANLNCIRLIEAGHPVPDKNGMLGAGEILNLVEGTKKDDLVLCLISGGGSALFVLPAEGITLKDKQDTIRILLSCGATIHEINTIRKHISKIKGGRLASAAYPAEMVSLILSDVVGDDLDVIASGPSVPDPSTFEDSIKIIKKYKITKNIPKAVVSHIRKGASGKIPETPKEADKIFKNTYNLIIAGNMEAINAARQESNKVGYKTLVLSSMIEGETRDVAKVHTAIAKEILRTGNPIPPPACILSGGETTVKITGSGLGGRNQEFVLAAAIDIAERKNIVVLSGGTDGGDGPTDAAGAIADNNTFKRAESIGLNPLNFLLNNDSYHFFKQLDDLLITGPTNTNVMDLRIMLVV
ncbi:MAG: glycerate kinase [Thermodesulfobacteriota bacterium]|nr:glycerate kinase [Thermodesulfobacteriota bacterium]